MVETTSRIASSSSTTSMFSISTVFVLTRHYMWQHKHRSDGTSSREVGHGAAESRDARDRFLRSDCSHHIAGPLSVIPPRSTSKLFSFLAGRVVLPYFFFLVRSSGTDS